MANRAYLFSSNLADDWKDSNRRYFDSRHNIPLAWWFLFREENVLLVDVDEKHDWQEVRFSADKRSALATLESRKELLLQIVGQKFDFELLQSFIAEINDWTEKFLLMNPWEVLQGEEHDYEPCLQIARNIHSPTPDIYQTIEFLSRYSQVDYSESHEEEIRLNVFGYTYW